MELSERTTTSLGLFSSFPCQCEASTLRSPEGVSITSELARCSQTYKLPAPSYVIPLHLLLGLRISFTPSAALQRRRTSPGMSLKYRHCSFAFQIGPSVNPKPVQR